MLSQFHKIAEIKTRLYSYCRQVMIVEKDKEQREKEQLKVNRKVKRKEGGMMREKER